MSLADEVSAGPPAPPRARTKVDLWLDTLGPEDRAAAERVLADPAWRHSDVGALLERYGLAVSAEQLGKYRRGLRVAR